MSCGPLLWSFYRVCTPSRCRPKHCLLSSCERQRRPPSRVDFKGLFDSGDLLPRSTRPDPSPANPPPDDKCTLAQEHVGASFYSLHSHPVFEVVSHSSVMCARQPPRPPGSVYLFRKEISPTGDVFMSCRGSSAPSVRV